MKVNMILAPMGKSSKDKRMLDPGNPPVYREDCPSMILHRGKAVGTVSKVFVSGDLLRAAGVLHDPDSFAAHEVTRGLVFPELSLSQDATATMTEELTIFSGGYVGYVYLGVHPAFREAKIEVDHG